MRSSAEVLEGNKVKLTVEVDEQELSSAVDDTFRRLQREVNVPGFRPGKVPRRLLEARLGGKVIREEVIRHAVPDYYAQAVEEASLDIIAAPEIDITAGEDEGPLAFDAIVEVRPKVAIPGYDGLQITVTPPEAPEDEVEAQLDRLREQFAELKDVERPVKNGDVVTLDVTGVRGDDVVEELSANDYVYEVGTGRLLEGADERLHGAKPGDIVEVDAEDAPGGSAKVRLLVKAVREKILPEPTDEWAGDASEFDTVEELRDDIRKRLTAYRRLQANLELREKAVEAIASLVTDDMPETLVNEEAGRLQHGLAHRLSDSGIALDQYLAMRGVSAEELVAELREQAVGQVRADLALRALAEAEQLEVTDDELAFELARVAQENNRSPREMARQIAEGPGLERLRSELRNSKAVTWLVEHVDVVDEQGNPMDRALLLEHESSSEETSDASQADAEGGTSEAAADEEGEE
jgi:trigger factor